MDALRDRGNIANTYSYGDAILDAHLRTGAIPQTITTFFGSTGVGKSVFVLALANKCFNRQIPCVYDTLEMDAISTMDRLIANRLNIPIDKLYPARNEYVDESIIRRVANERKIFDSSKKFLIIEEPKQSHEDLEYYINQAKRFFKTKYLIMYIDLYSMVKGSGSSATEIEEGMNLTHEIAKRTNCHLGLVIQANRNTDNNIPSTLEALSRLKPTLNNVKNSAAYAERSRVVLSVFRAKYYAMRYLMHDEDLAEAIEAMDDLMEISCLKQSQGGFFNIPYLFTPSQFKLTPFIQESEK